MKEFMEWEEDAESEVSVSVLQFRIGTFSEFFHESGERSEHRFLWLLPPSLLQFWPVPDEDEQFF